MRVVDGAHTPRYRPPALVLCDRGRAAVALTYPRDVDVIISLTIPDAPSDPDKADRLSGRNPLIDRPETCFAEQVSPRVA